MSRRKPTTYVETSVVSYFAARLASNVTVALNQKITRAWWNQALPRCEGFTSEYVPVVEGRARGALPTCGF